MKKFALCVGVLFPAPVSLEAPPLLTAGDAMFAAQLQSGNAGPGALHPSAFGTIGVLGLRRRR